MTDPDPQSGHIAPEELAANTELGAGIPAEWFSVHLAKCRYCMAIYAEFARARAESMAAAVPAAADQDVIATAMDIPAAAVDKSAHISRARRRRVAIAVAMAAGISGAFVISTWMRSKPIEKPPVRSIYPDDLLYSDPQIPSATGLRGSIAVEGFDSLLRTHTKPSSDPDFNRIAAFLVAGRRRDAEPHLRDALQKFGGESRFHNLAAILAYQNSDLAKAESELRTALERTDDSYLRVNLARVLQERERWDEANTLLTLVIEQNPRTRIADLAASLRERGR